MRTWSEVQAFATRNNMAFRVERYNMSNRGTLVFLEDNSAVAHTVKDAAAFLRGLLRVWNN